jgi:hypothetical protein
MPRIPLAEGVSIHCVVDDFLWPWDTPTPVLMMHGFARNALFWNRWVPTIAETHRVYRSGTAGSTQSGALSLGSDMDGCRPARSACEKNSMGSGNSIVINGGTGALRRGTGFRIVEELRNSYHLLAGIILPLDVVDSWIGPRSIVW